MKLQIGGSPCTRWSIAQTKNRETEPRGIGWDLFENYLIALHKFQPDYFLYENNKSMSAAIRAEITKRFGFEPICINSALVSAQNRQRLYWVGKRNPDGTYSRVEVPKPEDRGILLRDILETGVAFTEKGYTLKAQYYKSSAVSAVDGGHFPAPMAAEPVRIGTIESNAKNADFDSQQYRVYSPGGKSVALCGQGGGVGAKTGLYAAQVRVGDMPNKNGEIRGGQAHRVYSSAGKAVTLTARPNGGGVDGPLYATPTHGKETPVYKVRNGFITIKGKQYPIKLADGCYIIRKLTVRECMRLQTVPEWYQFPVSDTQAYKMLGNGWTVDVIAHILSYCHGIASAEWDVLSMYDGMACGHLALDKLGPHIGRYRATEIDKYAIKTACHNFPDIEQLGDAFQVREDGWT